MHQADSAISDYQPRHPGIIAGVVYVLSATVLCWPMFLGRFLVNPLSDQYVTGYSYRRFGGEMFRQLGTIPEWNPYLFGGLPFIGAMHGDIFYPTAWLRWILPTDTAMNLGFALHIVLAGVFAYALLRGLKLTWGAALTGGMAYQLTGIVASLVNPGHDGKLFVSALAPLGFLALLRAIRDDRLGWYGVFAVVVGLSILGHYQLAYYFLVAAGLWTLYLTFLAPDQRAGPWIKPLSLAAASVLVGIAITAVQTWPFLEYIPYSPRGAGGPSLGWQYSTLFSMPPEELMSAILPQFNGVIEGYWGRNPLKFHIEYLGVLVVMLAVFGWAGVGRTRRALLWAMAAIGGLFLLISLGGYTPFYRLWYEVMPMMKKVRAPGMAFFLVALPVAVMAAVGAENLLKRMVKKGLLWGVVGAAAGLAVLGLVGGLQLVAEALAQPERAGAVSANAVALRLGSLRLLVVVLVGGGVFWALLAGRLRGAAASLALVAVVAGDLWSVDREFFRFSPPASELYAPDEITTHLQNTPGRFRVLDFGVYERSYLMAFDIQAVLGYHGNEVRFYDDLLGGKNEWRHLPSSPQLWDLLATRYLLLPTVQEVPGFSRVIGPVQTGTGSYGVLYEADSIPPYVRVVAGAAKVPDDQIVSTVIDPRFPYADVILYPDSATLDVAPLTELPPPATVTAELTEWAPGRMTIRLSGSDPRRTYLLVSETWYPDWRATVDGEDMPVLRGQGALISLTIPPGAKEVKLEFSSASYHRGRAVSIVATLAALALIAIPLRRRRVADA